MTSRLCTWAFAGVLAVSSARLLADAPTAAFTPGPLRIHVTAIEGGAQFRASGQTKWQTLRGQPDLPEGAELRTGPKGVIQFTVGDDQVYRVDRLTVVKLLRANLGADGTIKTDVGMTYGRVSKDVDAPARPHEDTIVTPSSTLAVRGTRVSLFDQPPFEPEAVSFTGTAVANFSNLTHAVVFGAKGQGTTSVNADNPDAANNSILNDTVDPANQNALTESEQYYRNFNNGKLITPISNPPSFPTVANTGMPTESELQSMATGALTFFITWNTNTPVAMELIGSVKGGGEYIYPVLGFNQSKAGGQLLFNNIGGPGGGYEVITYPNIPPTGAYTIAAINVGSVNTTAMFYAFENKDGTVQQTRLFNANNPTVAINGQPQSLPTGQTDIATAIIVQPTAVTASPAALRAGSTSQTVSHSSTFDQAINWSSGFRLPK